MVNISDTIKSFLEKYDLEKSDLVYLVAFSGGYDSMCLLDNLKKISSNRIIAIHLNHGWRGPESDLEEENCKNFCKQIGVEIYCGRLSSEFSHTETVARVERYKFFEDCAKKYGSKIIFTAHNKNDNAETLMYRISKGTGIVGLQGISEKRDIYYRPLLNIERKDIEKYCQENSLKPNNDSSNSDTKYKRNYIRKEVLPKLEEINSDIVDKLNSLSDTAKEEEQIVDEYLNIIYKKLKKDNKYLTSEFLNLSESIQNRIIYNLFIENNLDYDKTKISYILNFILGNKMSKSGKTCSLADKLWLFVNDKYFEVIEKAEGKNILININNEGKYNFENYIFEIEKMDKDVKNYPSDSENICYVDLSNFDINFELRGRNDGDIIKPLGSCGTQKLKKYLNNKKIPNHIKNELLFLVKDNEILWAIGLGISDKIKVTNKPTHYLKLVKKES